MTSFISTSFCQYLFSDNHKCLSFTKLRTVRWLKICFHSYPTMKTVLKVIVIDALLMISALLKIIISEFFHRPCSSLNKTLSKFPWLIWENLKLICLIWKKLAAPILVYRKTRETNKTSISFFVLCANKWFSWSFAVSRAEFYRKAELSKVIPHTLDRLHTKGDTILELE